MQSHGERFRAFASTRRNHLELQDVASGWTAWLLGISWDLTAYSMCTFERALVSKPTPLYGISPLTTPLADIWACAKQQHTAGLVVIVLLLESLQGIEANNYLYHTICPVVLPSLLCALVVGKFLKKSLHLCPSAHPCSFALVAATLPSPFPFQQLSHPCEGKKKNRIGVSVFC